VVVGRKEEDGRKEEGGEGGRGEEGIVCMASPC